MKKRILFMLVLALAVCCFLPVRGEGAHRVLSLGEIRMEDYGGLSIPVFTGEGWTAVPVSSYYFYQTKHENGYIYIQSIDTVHEYGSAVGDENTVGSYFTRLIYSSFDDFDKGLLRETIRHEDFPFLLLGSSDNSPHFFGTGSLTQFRYLRGRMDWTMTLGIFPEAGTETKDGKVPVPDEEDIRKLAGMFVYNEADSEVGLKVSTKSGETTMISGRNLQMAAAFNNPNLVSKKEKNDGVLWSVRNAAGNTPEGVTISKQGVLSADPKKVQDVLDLTVEARSESYLTRDTMQIRVAPRTDKITADPADVVFYVGTPASQTVRAVLTPETVPADLLSWSIPREDLVTVTPGEDGTAVLATAAEKKGQVNVTLKEAGGRSTQIRVSVIDPVTDLELTVRGTPKHGGSVNVQAVLTPKNPGSRTLEWSLDVDESIAVVNNNGQVRIMKDTPAGTKITVTCRATGAPEPVVRTLEIITE